MKYIELIYSDIVIRENGTVKNYLAFTDYLGNILSVMDEDGNKVFDASYDAWGRQTVTRNDIGLHRGYTGHEMLNEFDIINMNRRSLLRSRESNGRLYDPVLGRFFSPDNYVQLPDYSQSFNRYSYCLNNPLKYTDPSGNLFGIDDAIIAFAVFNMASSMMQASFEGKSVWKAGALSLLSSAASYGIGELFKGAAATFGNELLRAGAHGLASGVVSALDGGNFASAFVSGAAASGIGSYAQSVNMNSGLMVASTTVMGSVVAWATGGDFLQGAMQGMQIGLLNHAMHDGDDDKPYKVLPDGTVELNEIVVTGRVPNRLVPFRSEYVCVTFDRGADHPIALSLSIYLNSVLQTASLNGIHSVNISSTSNHPSNATRSAHSTANGSRAIDINYINGQHVSPQNEYARYLQNLIRDTPGYLENYGPFIINKVEKGKVIPAPWARKIRGGHYDHVHISMPK
ncbi:RHS repeat-associated core domain-containing protein [Hoylesella marshii]|uniref:RHS repeat-associated core domain protein n=1 Tax=Hoylesella marshii DSM 16973 = JCM 13450 TaxID=862515 RepID=E0NQ57_9BACT|nr:RHS repeat-associated core domain-containing protein [Hoylesella marshii]EFM02750.1 RHS repeat-associated core domain protein [Hoylesella marshii DSM 16973 = JCM 13450]